MRLVPTFLSRKTADPNDPTGGATLDALMARQRMLMQNRPETPAQIASPWQGAALIANSLVNGLQQNQAQEQEAAGRAQLAAAIAGIDPMAGATPEQMATVARLDPDLSQRLLADATQARRQDANWQRSRQAQLEDRSAGYEHEAQINTRETQEQIEQENRNRADWDTLPDGSQRNKLTGETKAAPAPRVGYRPATAEELAAYPNLDKTKAYEINTVTGQVSPVGSGSINIQLPPAEIAARIALGDTFLANLPDIMKDVDAGIATGPVDAVTGTLGFGRSGEIRRQVSSGVDALVRNLTGAGKSESEARDYANRYMIAPQDGPETVKSKLTGLQTELTAIKNGVMAGRGGGPVSAPSPANSATPPPAPANPGAPGGQDQINVLPNAPGETPATPQTDAEYNALPKGALYIDPDDKKQYRKP